MVIFSTFKNADDFWIWRSSVDEMLGRRRIFDSSTLGGAAAEEDSLFLRAGREEKDQKKGGTSSDELCFPNQFFSLYISTFRLFYPNNDPTICIIEYLWRKVFQSPPHLL